MSKISQKTMHRIAEDALGTLHESFPQPLTTRAVALELARDKEFVLKVMQYLEQHGMVGKAAKKTKGEAVKWNYWKLSEKGMKAV
ncbi:hypothetical protein HY995_03535 [Candidatus Micrarchaeota archaeon]|nr:hypothetical protein [Candidatus Micrarchaeota archaeon]MBI5177132.1 hypothetical protein [Candidatus Micrarchaeota archaeon]